MNEERKYFWDGEHPYYIVKDIIRGGRIYCSDTNCANKDNYKANGASNPRSSTMPCGKCVQVGRSKDRCYYIEKEVPPTPTYAAEWKQARERFEGILRLAEDLYAGFNSSGHNNIPGCPFCKTFDEYGDCGKCPWKSVFGNCHKGGSGYRDACDTAEKVIILLRKIVAQIPKEDA